MTDQLAPAAIAASHPFQPRSAEVAGVAVPSGAFALAGMAVGLLLVAWLAIYFFVFIARGAVG